jgi:hypothetical protein
MPRFFFDAEDGRLSARDDVGTDCDSNDAARIEALASMAELARQYLPTFGPDQRLEMTVRDEHGRSLLHLDLKLTVTPLI